MAMLMIAPVMLLTPVRAETVPDAWTVMFYVDGDNNVESYALRDMEELKATGSDEDVNIVVLLDTLSGPADLLYVNQGSTTTLAPWGEVAMDDPATLTRFIGDAATLYPAEKYALVVWDHGGAWLGICWDDTSGTNARLTMPELRSGIANAGVPFETIVLNACVMAQAEVAYTLNGLCDYTVVSQLNMYALGFPYTVCMDDLKADAAMDGRTLALTWSADYVAYYQSIGYSDVTISVLDMAYVQGLTDAVKAFSAAAIPTTVGNYRTYRTLRTSVESEYNQADLESLMAAISASSVLPSTVKAAAAGVVSAVNSAVIYEWHTSDVSGMNGMGIYWPMKSVTYYWGATLEGYYRAMDFASASGWADFLDAFYAAK
jgi:hypothetical protein